MKAVVRKLVLLSLVLGLFGCSSALKRVGLQRRPDQEMRKGPGGTLTKPETLSPFIAKRLVMADQECRFFQLRVPSRWYWKLVVTAANDRQGLDAKLSASFETEGGGWQPLVPLESRREFTVTDASCQGAIGVANTGDDRLLTLRICQSGSPVHVTLESQVSAFGQVLLNPPLNKELPERPETP